MNHQTHENALQRQRILQRLYTARQAQSATVNGGWLSERDLKDAEGDIAFALDVLGELGFVRRDGARVRITGPGVIACESNWVSGA